MRITPDIAELYGLDPTLECYDNSTLNTIDSCIRKAFWKLLYTLPGKVQPGVQERVGTAAFYGSSVHSAMDKFYSPVLYRNASFEQRRLAALRSFSSKYAELFSEPELIESPYRHQDGILLLDDYYSHYEAEDAFFIPIETESCTIVLLDELNPPAYWIGRQDGIVFRPAMGDYLIREYKTTKSSLQNKLDELRISRQGEGYVWSTRQFETEYPISGVLADVLAVRVREKDPGKLFARDIFHVSTMQAQQWYVETIAKIKRWREICERANQTPSNALTQHFSFDRNTNECLRYGKCSYYDLCVYGLQGSDMTKFLPNDWNPLYTDERIEFVP